MELIGGRRRELGHEVQVEVPRGGFGVHEQIPAPDLRPQRVGPGDHVLEQPGPEVSALVCNVDADSSDQRSRLGLATGALAYPCGRLGE